METQQTDTVKEAMKGKYLVFQKLLHKNNSVLELMADFEEKLSGEYLFDMQYLKKNVKLLDEGVAEIIENLNALSQNKYKKLYEIHKEVNQEIGRILAYKFEIPFSDLTISLDNLTGDMPGISGGKSAHLGEVKNIVQLPTPEGFAVTAYAFKKFMDHNNFAERINEKLSALNIDNLEDINKASNEIYDMIRDAEIPDDLEKAIQEAVERLKLKIEGSADRPSALRVSVRSSAIREDSEFSFAGQYATFLNISEDFIIRKYKEVVASLFTPRAIFYSKTKGLVEGEMVMAVGVLSMIDARAAGVMYTRNPNDPEADHIIINAIYGLGKWVVDGTITPDIYTVSRHPEGVIIDKRISSQEKMLVCGQAGKLEETAVPEEQKGKQCITDEQIRLLAKYALKLENYYKVPQDIEWAVGKDEKIYILQTRPLRTLTPSEARVCLPTRIAGYNVFLDKGVIACKGVGCGKAFILKEEEDLKNFPEGAVLVARHTSPKYVTVMNKAAAIITDVGSATGHMASLSREYQVPTILDTEVSTSAIPDGQEITVDAINCNIYEGRVEELLEYARKKTEPFKGTQLFKTLEKMLKLVVPLNLVDPEDENFNAENCKTLHDITRFAHEISMREMFSIGEGYEIKGTKTVDLRAGIPVDVHMLDIDGGIRENVTKATFEDIYSIPFTAMLKGMRSMKWPEPRPADVGGLLGMMAHAASVPEDQLHQMGERSFCIISRNYMNFSIRLGYHFSMIEAYAGENINDNYIKFFFKGGGAALDRRLRRVRLIREILKAMGFKINIKEDVMDAILTKYKQSTIEEKLEALGKLTAYTKQLDMVMFNDSVTDMYIEDFVKLHVRS